MLGGNGRLPVEDGEQRDGEGFSGQDKAAPALLPRGHLRFCPPRAGRAPAAAGGVRKPRGALRVRAPRSRAAPGPRLVVTV